MTSRTPPTLPGAAWSHQGSKGTGEPWRGGLQRAVRLGREADLPHVFLFMAMPVRAADVGERAVRHEPLETARGAAHREDDVPAEQQVAAFDGYAECPRPDPQAPTERPRRHTLDHKPGRLRQIQHASEVTLNQDAFHARPEGLALEEQTAGHRGGRRDAETFEAARPAQDATDDADNVALPVEQGTAGIARVDRRVCQEELPCRHGRETARRDLPPADVTHSERA